MFDCYVFVLLLNVLLKLMGYCLVQIRVIIVLVVVFYVWVWAGDCFIICFLKDIVN